ncbi:spermatogenesis-associated protein 31A6-like [Dasypus novemcinctus]|uniref:spermatogenesis-associated protein 31A6-like n=1 Tax=Dasypus novemcinctus TaxID=9361 RepID=UPI00265FD4B8|nr:spermatogenesis-associated protein 31A6-like [Dasypus novemcinctus]
MWACNFSPELILAAQLPTGSSAIQMMENYLLSLEKFNAIWLSSTSNSWLIDITLTLLCGVGLFFLLLPCLPSNPSSSPLKERRPLQKPHVETRGRSRRQRRSGALRACRESLQELKETRDLVLLLKTHLEQVPDQGDFHQLSRQEPSGELRETEPAEAPLPPEELVDNAAPTVPPLAPTAPLTEPPLPLATTLSPHPTTPSVPLSLSSPSASQPPLVLDHHSHQPVAPSLPVTQASAWLACPQPPTSFSAPPLLDSTLPLSPCNSISSPLGRSLDNNSWLSASMPAIPGLAHSSRPSPALPWWWAAARALLSPTSAHSTFQQEQLSHHSQRAFFWGGPINRQVEVGGPSFLNPESQKLLELQTAKRVELRMWKENKKKGPDYHLNSLGNVLKPLGAEQDNTVAQPLWSSKDKPEQLPSPEMPPHPETLRANLEQKFSQFFWGLPFLHSESLVASVRVPGSVLFNGISRVLPIQMQAGEVTLRSQPQPLPNYIVQPPLLIPTVPQSQVPLTAQVHLQPQPLGHLQSPFPVLLRSTPQIVSCRELRPTSWNVPQSLVPSAIQNLEYHLLKKQLGSWRALPLVVKRSQKAFSSLTSSFPQGTQASQAYQTIFILPGNFPLNPDIRKRLEQHLQKRLIQQQSGLPCRIHHVTLGQMQPQRKSPGICHEPSQPSVCERQSSKNIKKVRSSNLGNFRLFGSANFQLGKGPKADLGQSLGRVSKYNAYQQPESCERDSAQRSKLELKKHSESDSGNDSAKDPDEKQIKNYLKAHVDRKLGQISEGRIPMQVRRSWLSTSHALLKSDTQVETSNLVSSKGQTYCINTSQEVFFLSKNTRKVLEAHIRKFWVQHRWGLLLKVFEAIKLFKLRKAQARRLQQSPFPTSPIHKSGARIAEVGKLPGRKSQMYHQENVITTKSEPALDSPLPAPSTPCEEIQEILALVLPDEDRGLPEAPLTGQEVSEPPQSLIPNTMGSTEQSGTLLGSRKSSLESISHQAMADSGSYKESKSPIPGTSSPGESILEMKVESHSSSSEEKREAIKADQYPAHWPKCIDILRTSQPASCHILSEDLSGLGTPGTSQCSTPCGTSDTQVKGQPYPIAKVISELETEVKVKPENEPQEGLTDLLHASGSPASRVHTCCPGGTTSGKKPSSHMVNGSLAARERSLGQQESKTLTLQAPLKNQNKIFAPSTRIEDRRRPRPEEHEERCVGLGNLPARRTSQLGQARGLGNIPGKTLQSPPKKEESRDDIPFMKKMSGFLHWVFPNKSKGQEGPLCKRKPMPASAQGHGPVKTTSACTAKEAAKVQALVTAVGHMLEKKITLQTPERGQQKRKAPVPVQRGGSFCHKSPPSTEQRKVMSNTICNRYDTPERCSVREKWVRDKDGSIWKFVGIKMSNYALPPGVAVSPVGSHQEWSWMLGESARPPHCPRHCLIRDSSCNELENASPPLPSRKCSVQGKIPYMQRKSFPSY